MKNLRNLLNQDSDSFNEKLKIAVCSVLGLKFFLIVALISGCDDRPTLRRIVIGDNYAFMKEDSTWVINDAKKAIELLLSIPNPCEIDTAKLYEPNPCDAYHYIISSHGDIQAIRTDSLGRTWWKIRNADYALEAMYSSEMKILRGDTSMLSHSYCN